MYSTIRISDASPEILHAVLVACSEERRNIPFYLQNKDEAWAPQVHVSGSQNGQPLFAIITPKFNAEGMANIVLAARQAELTSERRAAEAAEAESIWSAAGELA